MTRAELSAALSPDAKSALRDLGAPADQVREFLSIAAGRLGPVDVPAFSALVLQPDFAGFLRARLGSSRGRMESLASLLLDRLASGLRPELVASIAAGMGEPGFRKAEKSFFFVPVDAEGCAVFEESYIDAALQSPDAIAWYLDFCSSGALGLLRGSLDRRVFKPVMKRLTGLILARRSPEPALDAVDFLTHESVSRFVDEALDEKLLDVFLHLVTELFLGHPEPRQVRGLVDVFARRYPPGPVRHIQYLLLLWPVMVRADTRERRRDIQEFLRLYGNLREGFSVFVWQTCFVGDVDRAREGIALFVSPAFLTILNSYRHNEDILKLLVGNIFTVLLEIPVRDLGKGLYPLLLKLLLKLRVEEAFLDRRAGFLAWLREKSTSLRLELEAVRIFLFEYVFLATGVVPLARPLVMTRSLGAEHSLLIEVLDTRLREAGRSREKEADLIFQPLLEAFRSRIWEAPRLRHPEGAWQVAEIRSAVTGLDKEDEALAALEVLDPAHLEAYHEHFMDLYRRDPEHSVEALRFDHWCRLDLASCMSRIQATLAPVVGMVPVLEDRENPEPGLAYTDGRTISLPVWINFFPDSLDSLQSNRNLALYIGLALHEAAHILGGTFAVDCSPMIARMDRPRLYHYIHNCFEDFRVEAFIKRAGVHPQAEDLVEAMNAFLGARNFSLKQGGEADFMDLLAWISDQAAGVPSALQKDAAYQNMMAGLFGAALPSGRFASVGDLASYGVERLCNLDVRNIMGVHLLAMEFHEILKHWPENLIFPQEERLGTRTLNPVSSRGGQGRGVLDQDELRALYDECNRNPRGFLAERGLGVLASLPGPESSRQAGEPGKPGMGGQKEGAGSGEESGREKEGTGRPGDRPSNQGQPSQGQPNQNQSPRAGMAGKPDQDLPPGTIQPVPFLLDPDDQSWRPDYRTRGTMDKSTRTALDDLMALVQTIPQPPVPREEQPRGILDFLGFGKSRKTGKPTAGARKRKPRVYSVDPATKSRTRLKELEVFPVTAVDHSFLTRFRRWEPVANQVNRFLAELLPRRDESSEYSQIEGDLDMDRLIGILADPRGQGGEAFLENRTEERSGDMEVVIGLDISGSTAQDLGDGVTVLDVEKAFALIFGQALESLTDRVRCLAFNSAASTNIYEAHSLLAVSSFVSDQCNRDGDFIRFVTQELKDSTATLRWFILLSDGMPVSVNYEGKEALDDTLMAMRECVSQGIRLIYLNVDGSESDYFRSFARECSYARHFRAPGDLLPAIPGLVRTVVESMDRGS